MEHNVLQCSIFDWMFSLRERETLQQVRANTETRRQSSRTWIVPEFHQLAIVTPHNPRVIILMSKSKLGVFICACDCYSFQMIQVFHMAPFKTYIFMPIFGNTETKPLNEVEMKNITYISMKVVETEA